MFCVPCPCSCSCALTSLKRLMVPACAASSATRAHPVSSLSSMTTASWQQVRLGDCGVVAGAGSCCLQQCWRSCDACAFCTTQLCLIAPQLLLLLLLRYLHTPLAAFTSPDSIKRVVEPLTASRPTYWWFNEVARLLTQPGVFGELCWTSFLHSI